MAEWLKATDCKSVDIVFIGSNPVFPNFFFVILIFYVDSLCGGMVDTTDSKSVALA